MAISEVAKLGVKVDPRGAITGASKAKRAITGIGKTANNVKKRVLSLQGALVGLGAVGILKSIITTASEVESLQVRLKFLTGSVEDSAFAFKTMNEFASKVPFSLADIEKASPLLLTVTKDVSELNEMLAITGDIAAISGLSFDKTAEQLQRVFAGGIASADLFRERGVAAFLGFEQGVTYNAEQSAEKIKKMWRDGTTTAVGATEELKDTFQGQVSMMQDAWRELKLTIADAGVFELASDAVKRITAEFKKPETLVAMQKIGENLTSIGKTAGSIIESFMGLPPSVRNTGLVLALVGGVHGKVALAALIAFKDEFKDLLSVWDSGLAMIGKTPTTLEGLEKALERATFNLWYYRSLLAGQTVDEDDNIFSKASKHVSEFLKDYSDDVAEAEAEVDRLTASITELKHELGLIPNEKQEWVMLTNTKEDVKEIARELDKFNVGINIGGVDAKVVTTAGQSLAFLSHNANRARNAVEYMQEAGMKLNNTFDFLSHNAKETSQTFHNWIHPTEIMGEKFEELAKEAENLQIQVDNFADGMANSIEDSIMKMTQGLMSFKDVVKNVFRYVAAEMIRINVARPLAEGLSGIVSQAMFGVAPTVGGGGGNPHLKAQGGTAGANRPYIVGERGPELFIPNRTGAVVPNNQLGSSQTINITYAPQINALDPRTAGIVIAENAPTVVAVVRDAFARNGRVVGL